MTPVTSQAALLRALTKGPGFGAELMRRVSTMTGGAVDVEHAAAYLALRRLEARGLIRPCATRYPTGAQRWFELTDRGAAIAEKMRAGLAGLAR